MCVLPFFKGGPHLGRKKILFNKEVFIGDKSYSTTFPPQPYSAPQHRTGTLGSVLIHRKAQFPQTICICFLSA